MLDRSKAYTNLTLCGACKSYNQDINTVANAINISFVNNQYQLPSYRH